MMSLSKQKTVAGVKYEIRPKSRRTVLVGWNIYENGKRVRFTQTDPIKFGLMGVREPDEILADHIRWALKEKEEN